MPATSVSIPQKTGGGHATLALSVGGSRVQHQLPQGVAQESIPTTPHLPNVAGGVPGQPQPTPTQWLGQPGASANGGGDPLTLLVGGRNQLQAAMLKQYDEGRSGDGSPELVKPGTLTLPKLPAIDVNTASIDIQDWLEVITSAMAPQRPGGYGCASWPKAPTRLGREPVRWNV